MTRANKNKYLATTCGRLLELAPPSLFIINRLLLPSRCLLFDGQLGPTSGQSDESLLVELVEGEDGDKLLRLVVLSSSSPQSTPLTVCCNILFAVGNQPYLSLRISNLKLARIQTRWSLAGTARGSRVY